MDSEATNALRFIPAGAFVDVRLRARISNDARSGNEIVNRAIVGVRGDPAQDEDTVTLEISDPPLYTITKSVNAESRRPGDIVDYVIEVENTGGSAGDTVRLFDTLPAGLSYVRIARKSMAGWPPM